MYITNNTNDDLLKEQLLELINDSDEEQLLDIKEALLTHKQNKFVKNYATDSKDLIRRLNAIEYEYAIIEVLRELLPNMNIPSFKSTLIPYAYMPLSSCLLERLSTLRNIKYNGNSIAMSPTRIGTVGLKILSSTIPMIVEHANGLIKDNNHIKTYDELLDINHLEKKCIITKNINEIYDYIVDTYLDDIENKKLGFTFSSTFDPRKKLSKCPDQMLADGNQPIGYLTDFASLEKLQKHDYSDIRKLMYER